MACGLRRMVLLEGMVSGKCCLAETGTVLIRFAPGLSQRVLPIAIVVGAAGDCIFGVGRELNPFQCVAIHEGTGVHAVAQFAAFGDELDADSFHLLVEVEVLEVFHTLRVQHIAEVAQALDMDAFALCHAGVHYACEVAQYGLDIGVADCGDSRQVSGDNFRFYRFALHDGLGIVNRVFLIKYFFPEWHNQLF